MSASNPPTYLVTGASRGVGKALSIELAKSGVRVILLARQSEALMQAEAEVRGIAPASFAVACDLAEAASIDAAAQAVLAKVETLDGMVHNAGDIQPIKPLFNADISDWSRSVMVNLVGVQHLTQALSGAILGSHRVRITTLSSGAAVRPLSSWSAYCSAKAGLDMWTRCLAEEGAKDNITAVSVAPGIVDTGMQAEIRSSSEEDFPLRANFVGYHEDGQLARAEDVASSLLALVKEHTKEQSGLRFDVRDL
ncbi:MAG TPA: SDR family NAD(P)-dependent oxidoreductase [Candidatus Poseidoniales archaeon]|nr:MAG TPA: SDR family NAD(P)-dependent oxidoreductase [Candidatus Poseidoniales archaeon]|tara:strand:+ start:856 stop:1611 length:756 start_codon:yes stop_codon:yes gene_type:complete